VLELVYANNSVVHMLTGKAISRAVRGHFLVDAALNSILLSSVLKIPFPEVVEDRITESNTPESAQITEPQIINQNTEQFSNEESFPESTQIIEPNVVNQNAEEFSNEDTVIDIGDLRNIISEDEIETVRNLYKQLMNGTKNVDQVSSDNALKKIHEIVKNAR